ncbi:hypothetical protein ARMGADRAFT_1004851 [Armillaria gallica]|uniref:Uncharacterized protein n=1 Tax=Armillaria gallica TaxID=47427 RepID=A0A2H3EA03_ARMGA|nr:hypothetical protein ARMGADRAFT_1004851 [Armillaria gallica]
MFSSLVNVSSPIEYDVPGNDILSVPFFVRVSARRDKNRMSVDSSPIPTSEVFAQRSKVSGTNRVSSPWPGHGMESLVPTSYYEHAVLPPWEEKDGIRLWLSTTTYVPSPCMDQGNNILPVVLVHLFPDPFLVGGCTTVELFEGGGCGRFNTPLLELDCPGCIEGPGGCGQLTRWRVP